MSARPINKRQLIKQITEGLRDADTISVDWCRGILRDETDCMCKAEPTGTTLIVHINGGAVDYLRDRNGTQITRDAPGSGDAF